MINKRMKKYKSFQETPVWAIAHQSASSIAANIAEGFCRNTTKELIQFLYITRGSCGETIYHLILARDLGYIDEDVFGDLKKTYDEVAKQLNGWINSLKARINH